MSRSASCLTAISILSKRLNLLPTMSSSRSRRNLCDCARRFCNRISGSGVRWQRSKADRGESRELLLLPAAAELTLGLDGRGARPHTGFIEAIAAAMYTRGIRSAPVAQLDRAAASGAVVREFESLRAHQFFKDAVARSLERTDIMILGMTTFTFVHVVISLVGILSGLVVLFGLIAGKKLDGWTALFLVTTVATSVTGFMFPFHKLLPSHVVGVISLVVLAIAILARYNRHLAGGWRRTYVISTVIALYLNVFVLVVQLFEKVPALNAMAPTQSEPPFKITQVVVMAIFVVLGIFAAKGFRERTVRVQDRTARAA